MNHLGNFFLVVVSDRRHQVSTVPPCSYNTTEYTTGRHDIVFPFTTLAVFPPPIAAVMSSPATGSISPQLPFGYCLTILALPVAPL
jgi:hypothetical protein